MKIFEYPEIQQAVDLAADLEEIIHSQKTAFIDFSSGRYDVPPPMQFIFPKYHSDSHIKGAYRHGSNNLVIKIANGSPLGINGIILVFASDTGELKIILRDEGFLTILRTAVAGILASELIPWQIENIGIVGSGHLAKMLYEVVRLKYPQKQTMLYARNADKLRNITDNICTSVEELQIQCDLIFTATSSKNPIIQEIDSNNNKAIIALGSDDEHKQELSLDTFGKSDLVIVDSKQQAARFGDVAKAVAAGIISPDVLIELGDALQSGIPDNAKTIIADFSGIAAQDAAILEFVLSRLCL